jgi:hypothetical protein
VNAGAAGEPHETVEAALHQSELGDWRPAVLLDRLLPPVSDRWLTWGGILVVIGRSMCARANGRLSEAWVRADEAAHHLPLAMRESRPDGVVLARLVPAESTGDLFARRVSALIWREQHELIAFAERLRCCELAREQFAEALIDYLCLVEHNPYTWRCGRLHRDEPAVDRTRKPMLDRASWARQFVEPTAGEVSQSVWQDGGHYRGLCAMALDRLAAWPAPNPWWEESDATDVPVHQGCLAAWTFARTRFGL